MCHSVSQSVPFVHTYLLANVRSNDSCGSGCSVDTGTPVGPFSAVYTELIHQHMSRQRPAMDIRLAFGGNRALLLQATHPDVAPVTSPATHTRLLLTTLSLQSCLSVVPTSPWFSSLPLLHHFLALLRGAAVSEHLGSSQSALPACPLWRRAGAISPPQDCPRVDWCSP